MASIIAMMRENSPPGGQPIVLQSAREAGLTITRLVYGHAHYFAGVGAARKAVRSRLRSWKEDGHWEMGDHSPIYSIQRWEVKTSKARLLEALQTGGVTAESVEVLECWTLDNANKLYSWKGWLTDEPDLLDEESER